MSLFSMTGSNGDPLDAGITIDNGAWNIQDNQAAATGASPGGDLWECSAVSAADGFTEIKWTAGSSATNTGGAIFRRSDLNNKWAVYCRGSTGVVQLFKREAGSYTEVGSYAIPGFATGTQYTFRPEYNADSIIVKVDGVQRIPSTGVITDSFNQTATISGFRAGNTAQRFDDFSFTDSVSIIFGTSTYRIWQEVAGVATVTIAGVYSGTPASIEYSFNGTDWFVGDAAPTGGTYSFDVVGVAIGQFPIHVRFSDNTAVTANITPAAVGDVFACAGQSNISCRFTNNQTFADSAGGVTAYLFGNDDTFKQLNDPYDSDAGQVDAVSADSNAAGSWIVKFANEWLANSETPVGFIPCAKGATTIAEWAKTSTDRVGGLNLYESMARRIALVGGIKGVFFQQGEWDSQDLVSTPGATYQAALEQLAADIQADFGVFTYVIPLHTITAAGYTHQTVIRQAQADAAAASANIYLLADLTDLDVSTGDDLHFKTDAHAQVIGERTYTSYAAIANPGENATFTSTTASASTFDSTVKLAASWASSTGTTSSLDSHVRLSTNFASSAASASTFSGVTRLGADLDSQTVTSSSLSGTVKLSAQITSVTASSSTMTLDGSIEAAVNSITVSGSSLSGVVRLPASFDGGAISDSTLTGLVRLSAGFTSALTSETDLTALVRLPATFNSNTTSGSTFTADSGFSTTFASVTTSDSGVSATVRLRGQVTSSGASAGNMTCRVRLAASIESETVSQSTILSSIYGVSNPRTPVVVTTDIKRRLVVTQLHKRAA